MKFDNLGNLTPYDVLDTTLLQMRVSLVDALQSLYRQDLFDSFCVYCDRLKIIQRANYQQLVGGSFVGKTPQPADLDVANLIQFNDPDDAQIESLMPFLTLGGSLETNQVDGHLIPVYAPDDERYTNTLARIAYFRNWFGQDRTGHPRGILRLTHIL